MATDPRQNGHPATESPLGGAPIRVMAAIPNHLVLAMDEYGKLVGLSRGSVVRIAVAEYFMKREKV